MTELSKNYFIILFFLCCSSFIYVHASNNDIENNKEKNKDPNIIFIFLDDLGWADLPQYGYKKTVAPAGWQVYGDINVPNIDKLSNEGTLFTNFYVAAPTCTPSRAGILTGQFPSKLKMYAPIIPNLEFNEKRGLPNYMDYNVPTIMELLKKNGYRTAHFGKWHVGWDENGKAPYIEKYGIDEYDPGMTGPEDRQKSTERITDKTIKFIEKNKDNKFYINTWLYDPHSPLIPTEEERKQYNYLSQESGEYIGALELWYSVLTRIDNHIGRILNKLEELDLTDDTIIIFASDNGPELSVMPFTAHYGGASSIASGPFRGVKRSLYEGGIRTPLIIKYPNNMKEGYVDTKSVITAVDFLPTICELTNTKIKDFSSLDGEDVSEVFYGNEVTRNKPIMWEVRFPIYGRVNDKSPRLAIRDGNWKLLMNPDESRIELYDITRDPGEVDNVLYENPKIAERLKNQLIEWQSQLPESPISPEVGGKNYAWPKND